jgi:hypothetical protein
MEIAPSAVGVIVGVGGKVGVGERVGGSSIVGVGVYVSRVGTALGVTVNVAGRSRVGMLVASREEEGCCAD